MDETTEHNYANQEQHVTVATFKIIQLNSSKAVL